MRSRALLYCFLLDLVWSSRSLTASRVRAQARRAADIAMNGLARSNALTRQLAFHLSGICEFTRSVCFDELMPVLYIPALCEL